jgi:hypothetical protein
MRHHSSLFFKPYLPLAQFSHDQTLDHSFINALVITLSSSLSSYFNLEANVWFKEWLWIKSTNITQCKH